MTERAKKYLFDILLSIEAIDGFLIDLDFEQQRRNRTL